MIIPNYIQIAEIVPDTLRRTTTRTDWLYLIISSLSKGFDNFKLDFDYYKFLASHNSQILSLEHLLNTILSPITAIFISDGYWLDEVYIYYKEDVFGEITYLYSTTENEDDTYLYTTSEYDNDQYDFIVNVPIIYSTNTDFINKLIALIKLYIHAGKNYKIIYF